MKAIFAVLALSLAAGCSPGRWQAPVEDRRPASRAAAKPPAKAPAKAPAPAALPTAPSAPEGFYTVQKGDTLYSIALEHGQDYREVAQWNSLDDPGKIRVGQVLRVKAPAEPAVVLGSGRQGNRVESRPLGSPEQKKPAAKEEPKLEAGPLTFAWPVKGKMVAGFAEPRQKGIDIEGRAGDAVTASAAGRVTYVGTGIPGLGKLVVIKHDQGYITVYAHNKDILVKEQQAVTRGQKIAELGEKLHFQIRKGAAAVDPMRYLPKS